MSLVLGPLNSLVWWTLGVYSFALILRLSNLKKKSLISRVVKGETHE
jgi:hypothetical protein